VLLALGMSDATPEDGITAEVVEVSTLDEVKTLGDRAKGKIVLYNHRIYPNGADERGYGFASGMRYSGASAGAQVGAGGMLIRSLATADLRLPTPVRWRTKRGCPTSRRRRSLPRMPS